MMFKKTLCAALIAFTAGAVGLTGIEPVAAAAVNPTQTSGYGVAQSDLLEFAATKKKLRKKRVSNRKYRNRSYANRQYRNRSYGYRSGHRRYRHRDYDHGYGYGGGVGIGLPGIYLNIN